MIRSNDCASNFAISHQVENIQEAEHLFLVEIFIDLANVEHDLEDMGYRRAHYGKLVDIVLREYAHRLSMAAVRAPSSQWKMDILRTTGVPAAACQAVWCVASVPDNFNPEDTALVERRRSFLRSLHFKYGFHVEEVPCDFCGYHILKEARKNSSTKKERDWERKEKGVDMALGVRLTERCLSVERPDGIVVVSGDADIAPAVSAAIRNCPGSQVMVASFSSKLAPVYRSNSGWYSWQWPPIILDAFSDELNYED